MVNKKPDVDAPGCSLVSPDDREGFMKELRVCIDAGRAVDCTRLEILTGNCLPGVSREIQIANCVATLQAAVPLLEANGMTAIVELLNSVVDHPGYFLNTVEDGVEMIRRVQSDPGGGGVWGAPASPPRADGRQAIGRRRAPNASLQQSYVFERRPRLRRTRFLGIHHHVGRQQGNALDLRASWGPVHSKAPGFPLKNGETSDGALMAFEVEEKEGKPVLTPAWISQHGRS